MAKPLRQADVVLVPFPFADLAGQKVRPAVVVSADRKARSSSLLSSPVF